MLVNSDYQTIIHEHSDCLSLCSSNQTCAAMYYDEFTSTCHISEIPTFLDVYGITPKAFLKKDYATNFSYIQCG